MRSATQFHDSTLPTRKFENEEWWEEYEDAWGAFNDSEFDPKRKILVKDMQKPRARVLCDYRALKDLPPEDVTVYDYLPDLLAARPPIAYEPCACKRAKRTRECHSPENTCILNAGTARYNIKKGSAWEVSVEEALEIDSKALDWGLVSCVSNARDVRGIICVCHPCTCCIHFRLAVRYGLDINNFIKPSRYQPRVDIAKCTSCQACVEACPFGAVTMLPYPKEKNPRHPLGSPKWKSATNFKKCTGCGNCVIQCPYGARSMKLVHPLDWIPEEVETPA
jgi:ferredoxin